MKKMIAWMLCLLMVLSLAACGSDEPAEEQMITRPAQAPTVAAEQPETPAVAGTEAPAAPAATSAGNYTFVTDGVELVPGAVFDPTILPEAQSVYEVPSCAIVGTDNLYNYGTYELTAFDDGTNELIYSILFIDPNITTTEGLALGDSAARVLELYGENYSVQGTSWVYSGDAEQLILILQGETVASIEYRMIVE